MSIQKWLSEATKQLDNASISTARLDALVLLANSLNKDKSYVLAHSDDQISKIQLLTLSRQLKRRAAHEPLSYILGKSEFYGREFLVNKFTLQPRPETETMIDELKKLPKPSVVVDVGTGSGCIAITTQLEIPGVKVFAADISGKCIQTAKKNASKLNAEVSFYKGSLFEPILEKIGKDTILVANLPYVPDSHTINKAAMFEPKNAIFGGIDGLDYYRQLFTQAKDQTNIRFMLTESLPPQHNKLTQIAKTNGFELTKSKDFIQVFENQA